MPLTAQNNQQKADCCFSNSQFQGICRVTPGANESCDTILEYLNTPGSVGKAYCNSTAIRGGWKLADCPPQDQ